MEVADPHHLKDVRFFLGLCSYYRKFFGGFVYIGAKLHALTKRNRPFALDHACQDAFDTLKERVTIGPVQAIPHDDGLIVLGTDASDVIIGVVLLQVQDGVKSVIAYYSGLHAQVEINYCTTRKELLVVLEGLRQFRPYMLGRRCLVRSDHAALIWFGRAPNLVGQRVRLLDFLGEFDFEIAYRPGARQKCACVVP